MRKLHSRPLWDPCSVSPGMGAPGCWGKLRGSILVPMGQNAKHFARCKTWRDLWV